MLSEKIFKMKYELYHKDIYYLAYGYFHSKADAEDIVQNVFLKYLSNYEHFKSLEHERYWLIRVAINECKALFKERNHYQMQDFSNYPDKVSDELSYLRYEVIKLKNIYKAPIVLYYYNHLSTLEIADILKISPASVRKRIERAKKILRERIYANEN